MTARDVQMFHREMEIVIFDDNTTAPIKHWYDFNGEECGAWDYPTVAVAGPDDDDNWYSIDLRLFQPVKTH